MLQIVYVRGVRFVGQREVHARHRGAWLALPLDLLGLDVSLSDNGKFPFGRVQVLKYIPLL